MSPHYDAAKLDPPWLYKDLVDVYSDRIQNWLLKPARKLLDVEHGQIAAVALATMYVEGFEIYRSGQDSNKRSKEFFRRGFQRIFYPESTALFINDAVADAMYELLRCGFAHEGTFRNPVFFGVEIDKPMYITWPLRDGNPDPDGQLESVLVNPHRYVAGIEGHFENYIKELRKGTKSELAVNFRIAVDLKWDLDKLPRAMARFSKENRDGA